MQTQRSAHTHGEPIMKHHSERPLRRRVSALARGVFLAALTLPTHAWAQELGRGGMAAQPVKEEPTLYDQLMALSLLSIPAWRIGLALLIMALGVMLRVRLLERLLRPFALLATKTDTDVDDRLLEAIERPLAWLTNVLAMYLGLLILKLPIGLERGAALVIKTFGLVVVAWLLYNAVDIVSLALDRFTRSTQSEMDDHLVPLVRKVMRVAVILIALVMIIQQWGYNVTSLVAGLGLGGLAFALAAQQTLSNLFGSIMIFTDRPFGLGDWVKSKHGEGIVEEIGLRSTKIRTFNKTVITVPNADVASTAIENFSQMDKRRIKFNVGLTYGTSRAQMESIIEEIRARLAEDEAVDQGFWAVNFVEMGASSLDILIYAFTVTNEWVEFMEVRQALYLDIMGIVEAHGASMAFPSQSVYVETPLSIQHTTAPAPRPMPAAVLAPDAQDEPDAEPERAPTTTEERMANPEAEAAADVAGGPGDGGSVDVGGADGGPGEGA